MNNCFILAMSYSLKTLKLKQYMKQYWFVFIGIAFTIQCMAQPVVGLSELNRQQQQTTQLQNRQLMIQLGSEPPPAPEQIAEGHYYDNAVLKKEAKQRELYSEINRFSTTKASAISKAERELKRKLLLADTANVSYKTYLKFYEKSYAELVKMLNGSVPLNLKRAVFLTESPYYKNKLSYEKYCRQIDSLVYICKQVLKQEGLSENNYMACHYVIQKLFSQPFSYNTPSGKLTFEPLSYDFSIYKKTEPDFREQFVSRLLNIKKGQCHSMPLLYLILAEELNVNAYLAIAPNHSYVKFGNQKQSFSFETTSGTFTSDEWIVSSGYISASAIKNRIYLDPLTKKQVIAECFVDLGLGLESLYGQSDFSIKCANTTLMYFPNSIRSILTINNMLVAECARTAQKYHFPKYTDYSKYEDLKKQFDEMIEFGLKVEATGYQKIPDEQYEEWRQSANDEQERRDHLKRLKDLQECTK